ncbi:MAG TPA: hypothetical protein IAA15_07860 [Candidatus Olsenella pullicola]|nr:hypothetical protein [Candidatus Olsenella pullicola]
MANEMHMNFYRTFYDLASLLPETERRKVLTAMLDYFFEGIEPGGLSANGLKVFEGVRGRIDASKVKGINRRGKRLNKTSIEPDNKQGNKTNNKTDNKTDNKTSIEPDNKQGNFDARFDGDRYISPSPSPSYNSYLEGVQGEEPPTLEDVRAYFQANCLRGDPDLFWATYDAKGWVDGNGFPVTRWTSQALKWSRMQVERDADKPAPPPKPVNAEPETTLEEDIEAFKAKYGYDPCA